MADEVDLIDFLEKAWDSFTGAVSDLASGAVEVAMILTLGPLVVAILFWLLMQVVDLIMALGELLLGSVQSGGRFGSGFFSRLVAQSRSRAQDKREKLLEDARHHGYLESSGGLIADPTPYKTREERQAYMSGFREAQRHKRKTYVE